MDIFGIGFSEILFILIIAMMIFGPRRLPEIAAKAGKFVADLRSMSQGLLTEWQREIAVAGRLEELQQARRDIEAIKQDLAQAKQELGQAQKDVVTTTKTITSTKLDVPLSPAPKTTTQEVKSEPDPAQEPAADTPPAEATPAVETGSSQPQQTGSAETASQVDASSSQPEPSETKIGSADEVSQAEPHEPPVAKTETTLPQPEAPPIETPSTTGAEPDQPQEISLASNTNHRPSSHVEPINGTPSSVDVPESTVDAKKKEAVNE